MEEGKKGDGREEEIERRGKGEFAHNLKTGIRFRASGTAGSMSSSIFIRIQFLGSCFHVCKHYDPWQHKTPSRSQTSEEKRTSPQHCWKSATEDSHWFTLFTYF